MSDKTTISLEKIKFLYGTPEGEFGPTLFVAHQLEEIEANDWLENLKVNKPTAKQILDSLI